jgi:hypothetical protein
MNAQQQTTRFGNFQLSTIIMPIPTPPDVDHPMFPTLSVDQVDAMRTSSWYSTFIEITPKATFIDLDSVGEKAAFLEVCRSDMPSAGY